MNHIKLTKNIPSPNKKLLKEDALALAELIYDIYQEEKVSGKITNGQNNAQQNSSN